MPKKPYKSTKARVLPIEWNIPDDIITRYATNMVVQRMEKEFKISFFELKRPVILEENKQEWDKVKS
ncbi:MAG: hypothetical protein U0937_03290, partial [Thermodesulfovibrionia bacterium]|nr:hypothetical protein [Thermodesulfovibrionia bacterium]